MDIDEEGSTTTRVGRYHAGLVLALLTLVCFAAYGAGLRGALVSDDNNAIVNNRAVTGPLDPVAIFTTYSWWGVGRADSPGYRPLTTLSFALNRAAGGLDPRGFHLVNLVLHALVSWLLFLVVLELTIPVVGAAAAATAFALLPIHSEAVIWAVGRAELLSALGAACALLAALRYRSSGRIWLLAAAAIALLGGLLAKENAVTILSAPVAATLMLNKDRRRRDLHCFVAMVISLLVYLVIRWSAGALIAASRPDLLDNPLSLMTPFSRLAAAISVLGRYLWITLWPATLSVDYSYNALGMELGFVADRYSAVGLLCLVLALRYGWRCRHSNPELGFGLILAVSAYSIVSNTVFLIGTVMGERMFYLPSFGLCLAAGRWLGQPFVRRRQSTIALLMVVALAWTLRDYKRCRDWSNPVALFEAAALAFPDSARVHMELASAYGHEGQIESSLRAFDRSLGILPDYAAALYNKGNTLARSGRLREAEKAYLAALKAAPDLQMAMANLSIVYQMLGRNREALDFVDKALEHAPYDARLHLSRGDILLALRRWDAAVRAYDRVLEIEGANSMVLVNRGVAKQRRGGCADAIEDYMAATHGPRAVQIAFANASVCLQRLGRQEELRELEKRAILAGVKTDY